MNASTSSHHTLPLLGLAALVLLMLACSSLGDQGGLSIRPNDLLPEPSVGLEGLQSYRAVYDLTLRGALDGKSVDRHVRIEESLITGSGDEEIIWQDQETGGSEILQHTLRLGNAVYTQSKDELDCWGEYNDQPEDIVPRPASLLLPVTRASQVGAETVNGVASMHYHFDQDGLSLGEGGTSGEMWIAQEGEYVVKYALSIPGPASPTGEGAEIEETLSYELTEVNSIQQIELPAGCVPVLVDIPAMDDAQDVYRSSGHMDYTTSSEAAQVIDFYNQTLPASGWTQVVPSLASAETESQTLDYTQGDQQLNLFLDKSGGSLKVTVVLFNPAQAPQEPSSTPDASPTPGIRPTADASQSGLPADVPLYPGATDLQTVPNGANVSTADPPESVAAFNNEQLPPLGWSLLTEMNPTAGSIVQSWTMTGRMLTIMIQEEQGGRTTIMLMLNQQ